MHDLLGLILGPNINSMQSQRCSIKESQLDQSILSEDPLTGIEDIYYNNFIILQENEEDDLSIRIEDVSSAPNLDEIIGNKRIIASLETMIEGPLHQSEYLGGFLTRIAKTAMFYGRFFLHCTNFCSNMIL